MSNKIIFNGKEYSNIDEMPPEIRVAYQAVTQIFVDEDKNGVPDIFEKGSQSTGMTSGPLVINQTGFSKIIFQGKEYSSPDEMPTEAREAYDKAMSAVLADRDQNGVPDVFEKSGNTVIQMSKQFSFGNKPPATTSSTPISTPTASSGTSNDTMMFLLGATIVILLLVVVALLFLFFFGPLARRG